MAAQNTTFANNPIEINERAEIDHGGYLESMLLRQQNIPLNCFQCCYGEESKAIDMHRAGSSSLILASTIAVYYSYHFDMFLLQPTH